MEIPTWESTWGRNTQGRITEMKKICWRHNQYTVCSIACVLCGMRRVVNGVNIVNVTALFVWSVYLYCNVQYMYRQRSLYIIVLVNWSQCRKYNQRSGTVVQLWDDGDTRAEDLGKDFYFYRLVDAVIEIICHVRWKCSARSESRGRLHVHSTRKP